MIREKWKLGILAAGLSLLLAGCGDEALPTGTFAEDPLDTYSRSADAWNEEGPEQEVARGLAGKKGGAAEEAKALETPAQALPVEVYEGHLDTVVMLYMVGSNLESQNGLGTTDLHEICEAYKGVSTDPEVKIIVQTGGSKAWSPDFSIAVDKSQRYEVDNGELVLKQEFPPANMANPGTLSDFISWGMKAYPADRYGLILWDHGGGSVLGFGADELHAGSMMRLQQLQKAFATANGHFAFVGFDACLMGTVETAIMLSPYSDYMIASEEMEPGNGWFYTNWVSELLKDPSVSVDKLGKQIIDDFADSYAKGKEMYTLSLIDLAKIGTVSEKLSAFAKDADDAMENGKYSLLSKARSDARSFGNGGYEQVDLIDFMDKSAFAGNKEVVKAASDSICYFKTNMKGANGLAMYYPFSHLEQYTRMLGVLETLKFDQTYRDSLSGFCTIMAQSDELKGGAAGFSKEEWYRPEFARLYEAEADTGIPETIPFIERDGQHLIDLTPEQFDKMTYICMHVWLDTGEGYMEMGEEFSFDMTDDRYIIADFDNVWLQLNNVFIPFYVQDMGMKKLENGGEFAYKYGYVPAVLNDDTYIWIRIEIETDPVTDDPGETTGTAEVCGYWIYDDMEFEGGDSVRNLSQLKEGDRLDFPVSCYTYEGEEYMAAMGDTLTVPKDGLSVGYCMMEGAETVIMYYFEDVYGNKYQTENIRIAN